MLYEKQQVILMHRGSCKSDCGQDEPFLIGGIVSPQKYMHQEAVNPPLLPICLHLLFPTKQTTRFPTRAHATPHPPHPAHPSGHGLPASQQMKTAKMPF